MRKQECEHIKHSVYQYLAPLHDGKIRLHDAYRFFSDYGTLREIEKCLDTFVKDGIAEKQPQPNNPLYVFPTIAIEIGQQWTQRLHTLNKQIQAVTQDIDRIQNEVNLLHELRSHWQQGWDTVFKDETTAMALRQYVSTVFQPPLKRRVEALQRAHTERVSLEHRRTALQDKVDASYTPVKME